jgi:hypothetical protein
MSMNLHSDGTGMGTHLGLKITQDRWVDVQLPFEAAVHPPLHPADPPQCRNALAYDALQLV